jgi:hypothetical protein
LGEDDYDELNALWAKALRDLPDGSVFLNRIFSPKINLTHLDFLKKLYSKIYQRLL